MSLVIQTSLPVTRILSPPGWHTGRGLVYKQTMADILHRISIAAPPEKVFDIVTTPAGVASWWTEDCTCEPQEGSVSVFKFMGGDVVFNMRIDEFTPGRSVAWTCLGDYDEWNGTTLHWSFEPKADGGTLLGLEHRGWATTEKEYPQCNSSWGYLLHLIKDHAEGKSTQAPESGKRS